MNNFNFIANFNITFIPVRVERGRKFRGEGYVIEIFRKGNGGFVGSGVRPYGETECAKVYTKEGKFDSFNGEAPSHPHNGRMVEHTLWNAPGVMRRELTPEDFPHKVAYLRGVVSACLRRCGSDTRWQCNYLRKVLSTNADNPSLLALVAACME